MTQAVLIGSAGEQIEVVRLGKGQMRVVVGIGAGDGFGSMREKGSGKQTDRQRGQTGARKRDTTDQTDQTDKTHKTLETRE
eukprot:3935035-Rhodomonas_salina.1